MRPAEPGTEREALLDAQGPAVTEGYVVGQGVHAIEALWSRADGFLERGCQGF